MKRTRTCMLILSCVVITIICSCNKDEPKIISHGVYKAGAKLNGKDFIIKGDWFSEPVSYGLYASSAGNRNDLFLRMNREGGSTLTIHVDNFKGVGSYPLRPFSAGEVMTFNRSASCGMYSERNEFDTKDYSTNSIDTGVVNVRYYSGGRMELTFSFVAKSSVDGSKITVTKGFFSYN